MNPDIILQKMKAIIQTLAFILMDVQETGKLPMRTRVHIFFVTIRFYILRFFIQKNNLSEMQKIYYTQICNEFQSARECMMIISKQPLLAKI